MGEVVGQCSGLHEILSKYDGLVMSDNILRGPILKCRFANYLTELFAGFLA
jgi:hypothetical protein